jgi:hypothetical protein
MAITPLIGAKSMNSCLVDEFAVIAFVFTGKKKDSKYILRKNAYPIAESICGPTAFEKGN